MRETKNQRQVQERAVRGVAFTQIAPAEFRVLFVRFALAIAPPVVHGQQLPLRLSDLYYKPSCFRNIRLDAM